MADELFADPRLAAVYDALEGGREDLDAYAAMAGEFGARRIADLGCGTGCLALRLASAGLEVTGVDPAAASLAVARDKPGAGAVRWIHGDATALPGQLAADLVTMTGNAAQQITGHADWLRTLRAVHAALRPGGRFVFEVRDPARRAWLEWNRAATHRISDVPGAGDIENWTELTAVEWPLVTFRHTYVFAADGAVLTSDSTLVFREREEIEADLAECGYAVEAVRGAPDRPGREFVFVARRTP